MKSRPYVKAAVALIFLTSMLAVAFEYDLLQVDHQLLFTVDSYPGERFEVIMPYGGIATIPPSTGPVVDGAPLTDMRYHIEIVGDSPAGMFMDNEARPPRLHWTSHTPGVHYLNFGLYYDKDPNNTWVADLGSGVINVAEWPDKQELKPVSEINR